MAETEVTVTNQSPVPTPAPQPSTSAPQPAATANQISPDAAAATANQSGPGGAATPADGSGDHHGPVPSSAKDSTGKTGKDVGAAAVVTTGQNDGDETWPEDEPEPKPKTEPQEQQPGPSVSSWMTGWFQQAKQMTIDTIDLVKKDLAEFGDVVTDEASSISTAVIDKASPVTEVGTKLLTGLSDGVNRLLLLDDTTIGEEASTVPIYLGDQGKLHSLQTDPTTFTADPDGAPELFDDWLDHFVLDEKRQEISYLLANVGEIRGFYRNLVPGKVSDALFWQRYFYRVHLLRLDEEMARLQANGVDALATIDDDGLVIDTGAVADIAKIATESERKSSWDGVLDDEEFEPCGEPSPSPSSVHSAHSDYTVPPNDFVDLLAEEVEQAEAKRLKEEGKAASPKSPKKMKASPRGKQGKR